MNVRVRGIYTTALTRRFGDEHAVVQASPPIRGRFDRAFPVAPADVTVETTRDRQGVTVSGVADAVGTVVDDLRGLGRDTLTWDAAAPQDAVFEGIVTETLNSGAIVDLGDAEGFLPYANTDDYVDEGDLRRVQVREPAAPWTDGRAELETDLEVSGNLLRLVRGTPAGTTAAARMEELLPVDPPEGWAVRWEPTHEDADLEALADALERAGERAEALMGGVANADADDAPCRLAAPVATAHVWFGRESRFALDDWRREVTTTMPGHHRVKAGSRSASAAVDLVEAMCDPSGEFPFDVVSRQFGPVEGDTVAIDHGKPDGRLFTLGRGEVTDRDPGGSVTVEREMSPGGTYDALGVERRAGDVAVTKFHEGRWWYATVYRGDDGEKRGTYVNICTSLEIFPETVRYVDLHVDVVKNADGTVERVDDAELDAAVEAGHVREPLADRARQVATKVEDAL